MVRALAAALVLLAVAGAGLSHGATEQLIVFSGDDGLYVVSPDGGPVEKIPGTRAYDYAPKWSPDGGRIAFWSKARHASKIVVINADGSGRTVVTDGEYPDWSPDGTRIAFDSKRTGDWQLWSIHPDGSGLEQLLKSPQWDLYPLWSPDGRSVAFSRNLGSASQVFTLQLGSGQVTALTDGSFTAVGESWSPDGSRIAFDGYPNVTKSQVYTVDRSGGVVRLTHTAVNESSATWSPDGQRIAFESSRTGWDEIYVMNADGSHQRRLTRLPSLGACCPDWQG